MRLLITGGAGFIALNLALMFANRPGWRVITFDNLRRRDSELALARLQGRGIAFIHGDVRNSEDLEPLGFARLARSSLRSAARRGRHRRGEL
jgi:CDP-paratose 2-epimerase